MPSRKHPSPLFRRWIAAILPVFALLPSPAWANTADSIPLASGDVVKVDILDDEKEPTDQSIALDGSIQAPLLGSVKVAGLSVAEALDVLNRRYIEQHIFVVPKVGFSVTSYRPIFVIGDVRTPGSYPFQPRLSVEKAIGLAGGQLASSPVEDPILARARLRAELEAAEAVIIREALGYARLTAEMAGRWEIRPEDIPEAARPFVEGPLADSIRDVEQQIAKANLDAFSAQKAVLGEQIDEAQQGLALLERLLENVNGIIELAREDLKRTQTLRKQGLNTQSNISNNQRQLAEQEGRQLQVLSDLSDNRRNIGLLKSRLVEISQTRNVNALVDLQTRNVSLAAALASERRAEEQLVLITSLTAEKLAANKQIVLDFTLRRYVGDGTQDLPATPTTTLVPGDVLIVKIRGSDEPANVATLPMTQP